MHRQYRNFFTLRGVVTDRFAGHSLVVLIFGNVSATSLGVISRQDPNLFVRYLAGF